MLHARRARASARARRRVGGCASSPPAPMPMQPPKPTWIDARAHHLADRREPGLPRDDGLGRRERAREDRPCRCVRSWMRRCARSGMPPARAGVALRSSTSDQSRRSAAAPTRRARSCSRASRARQQSCRATRRARRRFVRSATPRTIFLCSAIASRPRGGSRTRPARATPRCSCTQLPVCLDARVLDEALPERPREATRGTRRRSRSPSPSRPRSGRRRSRPAPASGKTGTRERARPIAAPSSRRSSCTAQEPDSTTR